MPFPITHLRRLLSLALLGLAAAPALAADEVVLKIAHFLPSISTAQKQVLEPWCDELTRQSAGRLKCQFYASLQLGGTAAQLAEQVKTGVADIAWTAPGFSTGRFPKTEVLELPGIIPLGGLSGGRAIWRYYEDQLKSEYHDYKVLAMHGDGGMNVHTAGKPLARFEDFNGLKLRAPNRTISRTLAALGAMPVAMPPAQVTEALSKGVVDGASTVWEVMVPTKMDEVTRVHFETPADKPALGGTVLSLLMNKQKYDSLPADLKAIIDRNSGLPLVETFGKVYDVAANKARDKVKAMPGHTVTVVPAADYDRALKRLEVVQQEWVDANKDRFPAEQLLKAARQLSAAPAATAPARK